MVTPKYIFGYHDPGGEHLFADKKGWIVFTEELGHDPNNHSGGDYLRYEDAGYGVIARLNNGYGSTGTIPLPNLYGDFAIRCANFVQSSKGCGRWIIGNEPNHAQEWPNGQLIAPEQYANCFNECAQAIYSRVGTGHEVIMAGIAPWTEAAGDWVAYFSKTIRMLRGCHGIALHTYTHGAGIHLITSEAMMDAPYDTYHYNFRAYRDFLANVPERMQHLPVYITETDQNDAWVNANTGWVQAAYKEIDDWNKRSGSQKILCLALYRWPKADQWYIEGKDGVHADLRAAVAQGYLVPEEEHETYLPDISTGPSVPKPPPTTSDVEWDNQLTQRGIKLTPYAAKPGEGYWKITKGQYWKEKEHTFAVTLDDLGTRRPGVTMRWWWADGHEDKKTELKPGDRWMVDFAMYAAGWSYGLKVLDGPSDSVFGMGLGSVEQPEWGIHVSYWFEFRWTVAPANGTPKPTPRFKSGDTAYTTTYVNVRRTPGYSGKPPSDIITLLQPGTRVVLGEGPRFADGLVWWYLPAYAGWIAEGDPNGLALLSSQPPAIEPRIPRLFHPVGDQSLRGVTQNFGENPDAYRRFVYDGVPLRGHNGIDFGTPMMTPIHAIDDGTVMETGDEGKEGFGKYIKIKHAWGESLYAHLERVGVTRDEPVRGNQMIAQSGNTGNSSGPHLHFGMRKNGYSRADGWGGYINPANYLQTVRQ